MLPLFAHPALPVKKELGWNRDLNNQESARLLKAILSKKIIYYYGRKCEQVYLPTDKHGNQPLRVY